MVIEDSLIGLEAALGARMNCVITYTGSTKSQVRELTTCSATAGWGCRLVKFWKLIDCDQGNTSVRQHLESQPTIGNESTAGVVFMLLLHWNIYLSCSVF